MNTKVVKVTEEMINFREELSNIGINLPITKWYWDSKIHRPTLRYSQIWLPEEKYEILKSFLIIKNREKRLEKLLML